MRDPILSELLLQEEGYSVFENIGEGVLRPIGSLPAWFLELFGDVSGPEGAARLAEESPFLENFLVDAGEFWESAAAGRIHSGAWIERGAQGGELALEAFALRLAGKKVLVIANPERQFAERVGTLQTARNFTLEHERLQKEITKKEILLHCIVHDLSQPLTAIRGCLSLLGMERVPESVQSVLEIALRQSRRQEEMIRGILDAFSGELALRQAGESDAANGPDLARCAQEVATDFAPAFAERGANIKLDPAVQRNRDWHVYGDASRLRRIYTNLVENALRYSPSGSIVTLGMAEEGRSILATVDDQGPGLPQESSAPRLFELFGKGKEGGGKAGLGLYFCKMTVERWGGEIGAERRREGGTRFWFRLPRWEQAAPARSASAGGQEIRDRHVTATRDKTNGKKPRPLRILLAEDMEVNLELTKEILKKKGHTVVAARNGREAVSVFEREAFDVVLMDVEMPEMDGIEATRAMREKEKAAGGHTRIVAMTGHTTARDHKRLLEAGMDAHIAKPFEADALWEILEGDGERASQPAPAQATAESAAKDEFESALLARVRGDRKLLDTLIRLFQAECPKKLKETRKAVAGRDARALAGAAHAVKGLVGNFGAKSALAAAGELEAMGWNGDLSAAGQAFDALENEIRALEGRLASVVVKPTAKKSRKPAGRKK